MTKNVKVSIVVVDTKGNPVDLEFKEGMGKGVLGSFIGDVEVKNDNLISPMSLIRLQDQGYDMLHEMVKVQLEIVE